MHVHIVLPSGWSPQIPCEQEREHFGGFVHVFYVLSYHIYTHKHAFRLLYLCMSGHGVCPSSGSVIRVPMRSWAPCAWTFLYAIAFQYPSRPSAAIQHRYLQFLRALHGVLPCSECAAHFRIAVNRSIDGDGGVDASALRSRDSLLNWLLSVQNDVNRRTGKPLLSMQDVVKRYTQGAGNRVELAAHCSCISVCMVVVALLVVYVHAHRKGSG